MMIKYVLIALLILCSNENISGKRPSKKNRRLNYQQQINLMMDDLMKDTLSRFQDHLKKKNNLDTSQCEITAMEEIEVEALEGTDKLGDCVHPHLSKDVIKNCIYDTFANNHKNFQLVVRRLDKCIEDS